MAQTLKLKRGDGSEVSLTALSTKVLEKALQSPQDEVMLLALESGTVAIGVAAAEDPRFQAALLLAGQDLVDWLLNFVLLGAMMVQTIDKNSLVLEVVDEDMNEHHSEETSSRDSQADSTITG